MPILFNDPLTGGISAKLTDSGRRKLLKDGALNINKFRCFDTEILYPLFNPDNIDQDDSDILSLAVFDGTPDANATEYQLGKGANVLLNDPYFVQQQRTVVGNKIIDNPFFVKNQDIVLDIGSLTGDGITFGNTKPLTGNILNTNNFYSVKVNVGDANNSAINGTVLTVYQKGVILAQQTIANNTFVLFSNLTSNIDYKIIAQNNGYAFTNSDFGSSFWKTDSLKSNIETFFVGSALTASSSSLSISGTLTNGITSAAIPSIVVNLHYGSVLQSVTSSSSGTYTFTGLSANIQYFVHPATNNYYLDKNASTTGRLTASTAHNFLLYPISQFSGNVYYYNTTNPISNAVLNLYQGTTSDTSNTYIGSVLSDQNGSFIFNNIQLQKDYFIKASLQNYYFNNIPIVIPASTATGSLTSIVIYGNKQERPFIYDSPFPLRRRSYLINDKSVNPVFYDPCSWLFYTLKYGVLGYNCFTNNTPITHEQVLKSNNYFDLMQTLSNPIEFIWDSKQRSKDTFNNDIYTGYISDNYLIKIGIYALPYKNTLGDTQLQWDEYSKTDKQIDFPIQVNANANGFQLTQNSLTNYIDEVPQFQNNQIALTLNDVNKLSSLLPRTAVNVPITVSTNNAIPNLGLLLSNSFNIDPSILNITINPFEISQNGEYASYASVQGTERTIPIQTVVTNFEDVTTTSIEDQTKKQTYPINGSPLPIFIPQDAFLVSQYYNNNLAFPYDFIQFVNQIRSSGFIFNRVIEWGVNGTEYTINNSSAYITINTFGFDKTSDQLFFLTNASHYKISNEFIQFLITYFGIPSTDQTTISAVFSNNGLIDWLFYIYIINFGAYYNGYSTGSLQTLLTITQQSKLVILYDIIVSGKTLVQIITDIANRNYTPTQNALNYLSQQFPNSISTITNPSTQPTVVNTIATPTTTTVTSPSFINGVGSDVNNPTGIPVINPNSSVLPVNSPLQPQLPNTPIISSTNVITNQYSVIMKELFRVISTNIVNSTLQALYGFTGFDYKVAYTIVVITFNKATVSNTVKQPITKIDVQTQTITPIVERIINLTNVNNYFNLHPTLDKKIKMSLSFDLTNAATQDNFIKMINYLIDKIYTFYIGVEIIDQGQLTTQLNNGVYTLSDYVIADTSIQQAFCVNDKALFLLPLTVGGIATQTFQSTSPGIINVVGDPIGFSGIGFIKLIPFNETTSHILRVIKLSDSINQVSSSIVTGADYIAFDVLQVSSTIDLRLLKRYLKILNRYDLSLMNQDLNDLRTILNDQYSKIPGVTYVGSVGGVFASSTKSPNFWTSSLLQYQQGMNMLSLLNLILTTKGTDANIGGIIDVGQILNSVSELNSN